MAGMKDEWMATFKSVVAENQAVATHLNKAVDDLNPLKVLELFKRVTAEVSCSSHVSFIGENAYWPS